MQRYARLALGVLFVFLAASALWREEEGFLVFMFYGFIATLFLHKEIVVAIPLLGPLFRNIAETFWEQAKDPIEMANCKLCGGIPLYEAITCVPNPKTGGRIPRRRRIPICRQCHPIIGADADKFYCYIRENVHPEADVEYIYRRPQ